MYTHRISYLRWNSFLECNVPVKYETCEDALLLHLKRIKESIVLDTLKVERL